MKQVFQPRKARAKSFVSIDGSFQHCYKRARFQFVTKSVVKMNSFANSLARFSETGKHCKSCLLTFASLSQAQILENCLWCRGLAWRRRLNRRFARSRAGFEPSTDGHISRTSHLFYRCVCEEYSSARLSNTICSLLKYYFSSLEDCYLTIWECLA
jgi:hypothetical protein